MKTADKEHRPAYSECHLNRPTTTKKIASQINHL